jgi:hypothetical protein
LGLAISYELIEDLMVGLGGQYRVRHPLPDEFCAICLEQISPDRQAIELICGHVFH